MRKPLSPACTIIEHPNAHQDIYLLHGFNSNKIHLLTLPEQMSRDFPESNVIFCDAQGHGSQSKVGNKLNWHGIVDDYHQLINSRPNSVILIGHSFGGTIALTIGAQNPKVKKVFAVSAGNGSMETVQKRLKRYQTEFGLSDTEIQPYLQQIIDILPNKHLNCKKENSTKFYLIHGINDDLVPLTEAQANKTQLCLPEQNLLQITPRSIHKIGEYDLDHIYPMYSPQTRQFIKMKMKE